jgi:ADP-heptose:LPS heptosyltransferase
MKSDWAACKHILVIDSGSMSNLLLSQPAMRALKETFDCTLTVLTSSAASGLAELMPEIDHVLTYNLPWVEHEHAEEEGLFSEIVEKLKTHSFDAAVIFTVLSQNPLPAALLTYLAQIPQRLAYCRENPYHLLTNWVPEKEPYSFVRHPVKLNLDLVATIGAVTIDDRLSLSKSDHAWRRAQGKLIGAGLNPDRPWLIMHAGVGEPGRQFPPLRWIETGRQMVTQLGYQVLLTGNQAERKWIDSLANHIGPQAFSLAGSLTLEEFIAVIQQAAVVVSVNTASIHLAAAVGTPLVVLYAQPSLQHTPWKVPHKIRPFEVPENLRSKNEILMYVYQLMYTGAIPMPAPHEIVQDVEELLQLPVGEPVRKAREVVPGPALEETLFYEKSYRTGF